MFSIEKVSRDKRGLHRSDPIVIGDSPPSIKCTDEEVLIKREPDSYYISEFSSSQLTSIAASLDEDRMLVNFEEHLQRLSSMLDKAEEDTLLASERTTRHD